KQWLIGILKENGFVRSSSEGIRLMNSGAISVDGVRIYDSKYELMVDKEIVIRVGRTRFLKVVPKGE
ncbi:MAG: tyrosine--tRNA ligase, partial [bacterium]